VRNALVTRRLLHSTRLDGLRVEQDRLRDHRELKIISSLPGDLLMRSLWQGIVLRMLEGRESLSDCTHIIIDEVHERSIDSDFLLIVLREILEVRKDLK
jgi:hypothetical protein